MDLANLRWTEVHPSLAAIRGLPEPRAGHSMTQVSSDAAVLFGGFHPPQPSRDCWLLNVAKVLRGEFNRYRKVVKV